MQIEFDGATVCTQYDQLDVNGTITLGGTLDLILSPTYTPAVGQQFTIVDNDGTEGVSGTFTGLPERQVFTTSTNQLFQISYVGGTGNDIVLTYLGSGAVVVTNAPSGVGSLSDAIAVTNAIPGANLIAFSLPASQIVGGVYVLDMNGISPTAISDRVIIDATTQREFADHPIIELRGNGTGNGLHFQSANSLVRGLSITGWDTGVRVDAAAVTVAGNYLGLSPNGSAPDGTTLKKNRNSVVITTSGAGSRIGGSVAADRNVISGASSWGLIVDRSSNNIVQGNYVGTDPTGQLERGNKDGGISIEFLFGGTASNNTIVGNVISGNTGGITSFSQVPGLRIYNNGIGGGVSNGNTIQGNFVGTTADGNAKLDNGIGIYMSYTNNNTIGGVLPSQRNIVSGNQLNGLTLLESNFNVVQGNTIGLNAAGNAPIANGNGIQISSSNNNLVGGDGTGQGNIIGGNTSYGVYVDRQGSNTIAGNVFGMDATGTIAFYSFAGIQLSNTSNNTIGLPTSNGGNRIAAANGIVGIGLSENATNNTIQNNTIGLNRAGTQGLGRIQTGIEINGSSNNQIGVPNAGNVIGGSRDGIHVFATTGQSTDNSIFGNVIGLNLSGSIAVPNNWGIAVSQNAKLSNIGGFAAGQSNILSGNVTGILIQSTSEETQINNNWIGTDLNGLVATGFANTDYGIWIAGGTQTLANGNTIVRSGSTTSTGSKNGVLVSNGDARLTRNRIYSNLGPSISVTNSTAAVALTQARVDGFAIGNIAGATPNTTYTIEFFAASLQGQAEQYIGLSAVATDENGEATFEASGLGDLPPGRYLTATITGANAEGGDLLQTSEISAGVIPTAAIIRGLPARSPEGTPISLKAFAVESTINGYAVTGYQWNVTKGSVRYATGSEAGIQFAPDDEGTYIVTLQLTLTNALGDQQTSLLGPHSIAVFNVAPTPQFDYAPTSPRLGELLTLKSDSSDPGQLDILSYAWEVRYGSSSGPVVFSTTASTIPSAATASFTPAAGGLYFAKLTIDDNDGGATGFRTLTRQIEVAGLPSNLAILVSGTGSEGQTVRARVPESELIRAEQFGFTWTVTKTPVLGPTAPYPFTLPSRGVVEFVPDDDGVYRIELVMQEIAGGGSIVATPAEIVITNASPFVAVTSPSNTASIGSPINVVASITDPGTADTHDLEWSVERNGQLLVGAGAVGNPATNFTFTPTRGGVYTIKAIATDDNYNATTGIGRGTGQQVFFVSDVEVSLSVNSPAGPFLEASAFSFASTLGSLPNGVSITSYSWSAQNINGRVVQSDSANAAAVPNFVFTPPQGGLFLVSLSVVLSDGRVANAVSTPFNVTGVAPVIDSISIVSPPSTVMITEGMDVTVRASATDLGEPIGLTYRWQLKRGNGAFANVDGESNSPADMTFTPTDDDTYTVRAIVTDSQGNSVLLDRVVAVANAAPSVRLEVASVAGTNLTFSALGSDAGLDDRPGLSYAWSVNGGAFVTGTSLSPSVNVTNALTLAVRVTDDATSTVVGSYIFADASGTNTEAIDSADQTAAGTADQIVYLGLGGNDSITVSPGLTKKVVVFGGDGNDSIDASTATSAVYLDGGIDDDSLIGGSGDDVLVAGPGTNTLVGGNGNNRFVGGGNDTMTGGVNNDYYEVHFSTVVLNDAGGGVDTVDLTAAPAGITLDFSPTTDNIAQSVFPTSQVGETYHGSTLTLNGTFQSLIGSTFGDNLSANAPGVRLNGGAGNDRLSATGLDSSLDGGADNDLLILSNVSGFIAGGDGDDSFTGTLSNAQTTVLEGGKGDDTWNLSGPSAATKANVAITGGPGVNTVTASNIRGKISAESGNATGLIREFGAVSTPSSLIANITNSNDLSIFGGTVRGNAISVTGSNDLSIFGGGGDTVALTSVLRGNIQGGLFGGVATASPLTASILNSNDINIFGAATQQSLLTSSVTNSTDVSIFGGVTSHLTITNSTDIGIFGVSDGSINVGAPSGLTSSAVQIHISDFGSAVTSPVLGLSITNSNDVGIFGSAALNAAPLSATITNSNDILIFGSASQNVSLSVSGSQDIGIFGVVNGTVTLGPASANTVGQGVARATIETAGFGGASLNSPLLVSIINSEDVGIFGSSLATQPLNATVSNSNDISIFGSVVGGGILQATNSQDIGIFAQASNQVLLDRVERSNVFTETFGTGVVPNRLSINVTTNSNDIGIFGGTTRNSIISITDSTDISIAGGTAVNTIEGITYVGDTVSFDNVTSGTIAGGVFGEAPPPQVSTTVLQANILGSNQIAVFGSAVGTASVSVVNSQDISIFGGYGDIVDLMSANRVRIEGGVFGSAVANQLGLTASVAGNSTDIGIFGTNVDDSVTIIDGTRVGVDTRSGKDSLQIANVSVFVGLTDAGDDTVVVDSGSDILLYLAAGKDRAQINGGSNIRVIGAEDDDEFYIAGGNQLDIDGGEGADTSVMIGGTSLSIRSDAGNDVQKIFGDAKGYFNGGAGDETTQLFGGNGKASLPGQIDVVIDGQAGNDTLEIRPLFNEQTRLSESKPNPFAGIPAWIVLPTSLTAILMNRIPSSAALIGGDGDDTLIAEGNQRLYALGGNGNDTIRLLAGSNSFAVGGSGNDSIEMNSAGIDNQVFGDEGDDSVLITNGIRTAVFTEQGDDSVVFGGGSQSYARTGVGQDTITVNGGSDLIVSAEEGFDTINLFGGTNNLAGGGSEGDVITLFGGSNTILLGESGNDLLKLVAGTNAILSGGDGDDTIEASGRNADLYGDDGDDEYKILPATSSSLFQLRLRELQFIDPTNFESESRGSDIIDLSAFSVGAALDLRTTDFAQSVIAGQLDFLLAGSFEGIVGTDGDDVLTGTPQNNRMEGRGGNDSIFGLAGEDILIGGAGNDLLDGGQGDDTYLFATSIGNLLGSDTIREDTNAGTDQIDFAGLPVGLGTFDMNTIANTILAGGLLNLTVRKSNLDATTGEIEDVIGTAFADVVIGNSLDNRFELLAGDDVVDGRSGSDIYVFRGSGLGSDTITDANTGVGRDTLDFTALDAPLNMDLSVISPQSQLGAVTVTLTSNDAIENLVGTSFADVLRGNTLDNTIYGAAGSDTIDGGIGNDRLFANLHSVVLLDFDTAYDATRGDFSYNTAERNAIQASMQLDYAAFDWRFTQSDAEAKNWTADSGRSFVRLMFSQGRGGGVSGDAGEVDFRNINRRIVSEVNINSLKSAIAEMVGTSDTNATAFRAAAVALTTTIASHELAHTAGVRHADAFGPIGTGVSPNADTSRIYPAFVGPRLAIETSWHLIASPASVGSTISDAARDLFFGERESIRLAFNEIGRTVVESTPELNGHNSVALAQDLGGLSQIYVPNNAPVGMVHSGRVFDVSAVAVVGELKFGTTASSTEVDYYRFTGRADEFVNVELLVNSLLPRRGNGFDGDLRIYDSSGVLIAENDDDFEGTKDATLLDVRLPSDGTYYVSVQLSPEPAIDSQGGRYELFISRFRSLPNNSLLPSVVGDTLLGGVGAKELTGSAADDLFKAVAADPTQADQLFGGAGNDTLDTQGFDYAYQAVSVENRVNSAPVLSGANPFATIAEDVLAGANPGSLVSDLIVGKVTDADGPSTGIAVTAVDSTNGSWFYTLDGVNYLPVQSAISGGKVLLLASDLDTRIRFQPNLHFFGNAGGITLRAWDQADGSTEGTAILALSLGRNSLSSNSSTSAIAVTAVNDPPTDLSLANNSVSENLSSGTVVGSFSATDADAGDTHTFTLVAGAGATDNALFAIDGNQLKTAQTFDFEVKSSYSIRVRVSDGMESFEKAISINVVDQTEVSTVVVGDGTVQRSMVRQLQIVFDGFVDITDLNGGAFTVRKRGTAGGPVTIAATASTTSIPGKTSVTLFFSGVHAETSGSLVDGNYELRIDASKISRSGRSLDGDKNGIQGGDFYFGANNANEVVATDSFFRFFGDSNGNRFVDPIDSLRFRNSLNRGSSDPLFDARFDSNANNFIDPIDSLKFRRNLNQSLPLE